ncbi:ribosomal protein S18-alanine N-acetyltransferase [[Pseudomonas] carboxydohydrogena]|uniref:Ribosomal protein S18-alanine N-acetyltransferase n=1 Tax=Afipia carboxydohydrogena TaxID=290 RepID=A0ABY8BNN0_AFICR|nr:ribosomal protein S18-alanine N-acetyltransferase [[Pseudomonas] carboxydohydrogena]WEF51579.1 ribosomal protein S18-alanine N-acetyltransferase [[Pseudomonas] carboxydohydrogena]
MAGLVSKFLSLFSTRGAAAVEPANLRDAPALARLHKASFHRGWDAGEFEQLLADRSVLAHRLRMGNTVAGFILSRMAADEAEILSVAIAPNLRGRGLAGPLVQTHLGYLAGAGIRTVFLEVEENNRPARALYARTGFSTVGRRERYYKDDSGAQLNAIVMRRDLSS